MIGDLIEMETIHLKTVDPVSQALLQSAAARGLDLNWERYEKLQPQDGFLRAGLSCPFGCLQGPCRIDPFGRGADLGICGLDRDRMVAALLLRLCLNGVLEALGDLPANDNFRVPAWPVPDPVRVYCVPFVHDVLMPVVSSTRLTANSSSESKVMTVENSTTTPSPAYVFLVSSLGTVIIFPRLTTIRPAIDRHVFAG